MLDRVETSAFPSINKCYNSVFQTNKMSIGLVSPIETYDQSAVPTMSDHIARVQLAEKLGFSAVWLRDVPFNVPNFGDAGQTYDPFVYLGLLSGLTEKIALGVASIILPLRHPAHVAKAAASVDQLSDGRLILGIASGDRPEEYPAMNLPYENRGEQFRESFEYIRKMSEDYPAFANRYGGSSGGIDMLPKPLSGKIPMLITGGSQQHPDWAAEHTDGLMTYPRNILHQTQVVQKWRQRVKTFGSHDKPVMQPLYVDLVEDADAKPQPIHLGLRLGVNSLLSYLSAVQSAGINHVALNLRFNQQNTEETLEIISEEILPNFAI